jgi:hypothetical protein
LRHCDCVFRLSRFADKFFYAIIIFDAGDGMVMVMVHGGCSAFDGSEAPLGFDEEFDLCLSVFDMSAFMFERRVRSFNKLICH